MNQHLLVTVSDDPSALSGIRFVGYFFGDRSELKVTLFYTAPTPHKPLHSEVGHRLSTQQLKAREERGNSALEHAKEVLSRFGFTHKNMETKMNFGTMSTASDIVLEADRGLYDAVVLGHRGVTWLEESMGESVTREFLESTLPFPFWICRHPEQDRRNVLLCVDGSAPSLRMADHVGFITAPQKRHDITMLTIVKDKDDHDADIVFQECRNLLLENGVEDERIHTKIVSANNVGAVILEQADKERFAVVAMGRTGSGGGLLQRLFMGSASSILFKQLTGAVLWINH